MQTKRQLIPSFEVHVEDDNTVKVSNSTNCASLAGYLTHALADGSSRQIVFAGCVPAWQVWLALTLPALGEVSVSATRKFLLPRREEKFRGAEAEKGSYFYLKSAQSCVMFWEASDDKERFRVIDNDGALHEVTMNDVSRLIVGVVVNIRKSEVSQNAG